MPLARLALAFAGLLPARVAGVRKIGEASHALQKHDSGCTGDGGDPFSSGREVGCCGGLERCLGQWDGSGRHHFQCRRSCGACTGEGTDPFATGREEPCCGGLERCLGQWDGSGRHHYQCRRSCSGNGPAPAPSNGGPTCEQQLGNRACTGQFGSEQCHTCGERIAWLRSQGHSEATARERVAMEFFGECGACAPGGGRDVLIWEDGYSVVFQDDFHGHGTVDRNRWYLVHSHGNGFGNNELQHYTHRTWDNSWVSDGTLKIRARREDFGGRRYTSAKLESTGAGWLYGKFSIRARIPGTARGTWPAIWMMPRESVYGHWPHSGELDIMEHVGYDTNVVHGTVHTGAFHHSIGTQIGGSTRVDVRQWHVYTMEWRPDIVLFAVDNRVYQVFRKRSNNPAEWPFNQRFFLIMNMAVGGDWGGSRGIDEGPFHGEGQILEIDYVRVEQRRW